MYCVSCLSRDRLIIASISCKKDANDQKNSTRQYLQLKNFLRKSIAHFVADWKASTIRTLFNLSAPNVAMAHEEREMGCWTTLKDIGAVLFYPDTSFLRKSMQLTISCFNPNLLQTPHWFQVSFMQSNNYFPWAYAIGDQPGTIFKLFFDRSTTCRQS